MEHAKLFGTDGIRGVAGAYPLDAKTVRNIGIAAARVLKKGAAKPLVIIGRDTRESGRTIALGLKKEFSAAGIEVWDLGVVPTPGVAYMARQYPVLAGIVISASHNPYQDNGIKFFGPRGTKLPDAIERQIEKEIHSLSAAPRAGKAPRGAGPVRRQSSLVRHYARFLQGAFPGTLDLKGMRLVIDCANGATCAVAGDVLARLGADVTALNDAPDGKNINKDSGSLHPELLARAVAERRADCGLAFDGDGDRIIFVDEEGGVRDGDYLLAIAALHAKERGTLRNDTLVTTVMANLGLFRAMERGGVRVLQTPVGDRYVFEEMRRSSAVIGGEQSGHIIFRDLLPTGDGILSALQILAVMRRTGERFSRLCGVMQKYPQVLLNTRVPRKVPLESLDATSQAIRALQDRLKSDGRVLVRYSGTENLLRVMVEGQDRDFITNRAREIAETAQKEIEMKG